MTRAAIRTLLPAVLSAALVPLSAGALAETACPDTLSVEQKAAAPSADWQVSYSEQPPRLSGVAVFDGPPWNRVRLKYDSMRSARGENLFVWNLRDNTRSYWLQCSYERTSAQLARALPPGVRRCEVVLDRRTSYGAGGVVVKRMVCR